MMGSMRTVRATATAPTRIGAGTRRLRDYSLWSFYALYALWPLVLAGVVAGLERITAWTLATLAVQTVLAFCSALTLRDLVDAAVDGRPARTRFLLSDLGLYAASLVFAVLGFTPSELAMSPVTLALILPTLGLLSAFSSTFPGWRSAAAGLVGTGLVVGGTGLAHFLHPVPGANVGAVLIAAAMPTALLLLFLVPAMRWSISVLESVGSQERLDLMRADLAVAEERLRIARDLHDLFGRTLTAVALKSDLAAELAEAEGTPRAAAEARAVQELADSALREVRATLAGYRTPTSEPRSPAPPRSSPRPASASASSAIPHRSPTRPRPSSPSSSAKPRRTSCATRARRPRSSASRSSTGSPARR